MPPSQLAQRLALAAVAGAWIGFAAAVAGAGRLANPVAIPILFVTPIATVVTLAGRVLHSLRRGRLRLHRHGESDRSRQRGSGKSGGGS